MVKVPNINSVPSKCWHRIYYAPGSKADEVCGRSLMDTREKEACGELGSGR